MKVSFYFQYQTLLALIASMSLSAWGEERYEFYNGVRGLGMGGATIAVVNDETSLLLNPAALGKLRDYFVTVVDPEISLGSQVASAAGTGALGLLEPQESLDILNDGNQDKRLHLKGQIFPSIVLPNFGVGVLGKWSSDSRINQDTDLFETNYQNDYAAVVGFNFRLFDGRIKLGFNTRIVNRSEIKRTDLPTDSTGLTRESLVSEGIGVASDVGLILALPVAWLPSLAAVWRDVGDTKYDFKEGMLYDTTQGYPETTLQTVDVALGLFPIVGRGMRSSFTIEYRDVLTAGDEEDHFRRGHVGYEVNFYDSIFLRAGMNQRYWTAGFEIAIQNYQLQGATYGEEVGVVDATEEDRRYVVKFAYRF